MTDAPIDFSAAVFSKTAAGQSWRDIDLLLEKLKSVTADEVRAVARKYFKDDTLTIAVLDPQPVEQTKPRKSFGAVRH